MANTQLEQLNLVASAIGASMIERCKDGETDAAVTIPVADFRKIAEVLQHFGDAARIARGGLDADGFRYWLPLPQIQAQRREIGKLQEQTADLAARLRLHALAI